MTPTQRGVMFQSAFGTTRGLFHVQIELLIEQDLDVDAFRRSWQQVVERHSALRTSFRNLQGQTPEQVVDRRVDVPLVVEDWRELSADEQRNRSASYRQKDLDQGFPLTDPTLWRLHVARLADERSRLIWSLHYIVLDGISQSIVLREVAEHYGHLTAGTTPDLRPVTPYEDYVRWLGDRDLAEAERFWRTDLAAVEPAAPLPFERRARAGEEPAPSAMLDMYDQVSLVLSEDETARLTAVGERHGVSLATLLRGGWALLLSRYTGSADVVAGATVAGRPAEVPGADGMTGLFINTLPLRVRVPESTPWGEWMRGVQQRYAEIEQYGHSPLLMIQQWSGIGPGKALFDSVVSVNEEPREPSGSALTMTGRQEEIRAPYPLHLVVTLGAETTVTLHVDTGRYDRGAAAAMVGHLRRICGELVSVPDAPVGRLSPLSEDEHHRLVREWNDTAAPYSGQSCIHELFEQQVRRTPDATALLFQDHEWTYAEINRQANRLAHHLVSLGIGPGSFVAVLMERSAEMIPALLGILKAGGTYVPIESNAPVRRWHWIIDSLGITCVLTQHALLPAIGTADPLPRLAHLVCLDEADTESPDTLDAAPYQLHTRADLELRPQEDLPVRGTSQDLAYVIFTSGSTGTPKGVMVEHRPVINLIEWVNRTFEVNADDRILFITSLSFDLSVYDIFGILAAGGSIRLASRADIQEPTRLLEILSTERITFWDSAPAALMQLVPFLPAAGGPADSVVSTALRLIFMSGDWIPVNSPDLLRAAFPRVQVVGLGGATEATVWSNFFPIGQVDPAWTSIPYGKPIQNARYYILDGSLQPCPVDVPGDLYIGGPCLSLGYAGDPQLTAGKYIASPCDGEPGARIYKTGDRARWRPDGNMEFLGRTDSQVKIRGYRIELGEIDAVLSRHPAVRTAATLVRDDQPGGASLASYLVLDPLEAQAAVQDDDLSLHDDRLDHWQQVYDSFDELDTTPTEDGADYSGWTSSYTGRPIPLAEMEAWRQDTLDLVRAYRPQSILEVGCGTGLLLVPLARECRSYCGTDFSSTVLQSLQRRLDEVPHNRQTVTLLQRPAHALGDLPIGEVDTVLINSVIQYFPDVHYLLRVLDGALDRVAEGGRIIVGDVRSLPLLEAFHASVELSRAGEPAQHRHAVRQMVRQRVQQEKELTLDPAFFRAWAARTGRVNRVEIRPKRGRHHNELTMFRYQVVLHVGEPAAPAPPAPERDWPANGLTLSALREMLTAERPARLRLRDIPNLRVAEATAALRWIKGDTGPDTVGEWRAGAPDADGVDPEDLAELAGQLGYHATIDWTGHGVDGAYTVLLTDADAAVGQVNEEEFVDRAEAGGDDDWQRYAGQPLRAEVEARLIPRLTAYLQERLPHYMVPSELAVLDALPVTASGKLDRKALPLAGTARAAGSAGHLPARNTTEALLVSIYEQVMARAPIGVHDDFFALGGHSLLAVQLAARVRQVFDIELPVHSFFDLTTIARLAPELQRLQDERQPLRLPPLTPAAGGAPSPASFEQQRLFFLDRLHPDSNFYTVNWLIPWPATIPGDVIRSGLHEMLRRHQTLRTTFREHDGQVLQVVAEQWDLDLPVVDLSVVDADERERQAQEVIRQWWAEPFDLESGPLLRTMLVVLSETEQILAFGAHHAVFDGYSIGLFGRDFLQICQALADDVPAGLPELPVQYADYAAWQRHWLDEDWLTFHLDYWREQLSDAPEQLSLPTDFPRPEVQRYQGAFLRRQLSADLTGEVRRISGDTQVTNYITMLAGVAVLLSRYSGQDVVVIGAPIANRHRVELEPMIGFLVNTVALRVDLRDNPTFTEVMLQIRRQLFGAQSHQEVPFDRVVEALRPERALSHNPIFQVMVADESLPLLEHLPEAVQVKPWMRQMVEEGMSLRVARFDLVLMIQEDDAGLRLGFEYSTDLFAEHTVERMADHFQVLLESATARPQERVKSLSMLPGVERDRLVGEWSRSVSVPGFSGFWHELVGVRAERVADAVAVVQGDRQLSYGELDRRANQLAVFLQSRGVGPDVLVGLHVRRSLEVIVAILAVNKAGGAYVPLDPSHPADRLALLVEDAGLRLVLTDDVSGAGFGVETVVVDTVVGEGPCDAPVSGLSPDNLAYIIYTSGSTGRPKGVMVAHRNLHHVMPWQQQQAGVARAQRVLQVASYSFDFSVWEIITPLLAGGTVHIPAPGVHMIGPDLHEALLTHAIENLNFTPGALATLPVEPPLPHLKTLLVGGEAYSPDLVRAWAPGRTFYNVYGPTETTIFATGTQVTERLTTLHMGRPITNVELYVLDTNLQPVPTGVPGQLYIGGAGLTRGYLNRPDLTAEVFIADPFGTPGGRLYRSGDLVRYLPDGSIEFIGRADHQVKIRGFRIELGEIENTLLQHRDVTTCAVLVLPDGASQRLVAYLELTGSSTIADLQKFLGERLPGYMVPGVFAVLDSLPLNVNGKVDRRALAGLPLDVGVGAAKAEYVAGRSDVERLLAEIWESVLGASGPVSVHDNFFALGGDSILSLQVIFRAKQVGLHLTVKQLFQYQSIAELAPVVTRHDSTRVIAEQGLVTGPTELTPIQRWFFAQDLAQPHHFNQALLVPVPAGLPVVRWQRVFEQLVEHHDGLRAFFPDGEHAEIAAAVPTVVDVYDLGAGGSDLAGIAEEVQTSFDLTRAPLFKAVLITGLDDGPDRLLLVAHHLVIDVVSWRILLEDLTALATGASLAAKTTSWQHWARHLRAEADSETTRSELPYWVEQVAPTAPLPVDLDGASNTVGGSRTHHSTLGGEDTRALLHDLPAIFQTRINDALLAALTTALTAWTGGSHVRIDLEGHGREDLHPDIDLTRTIGWFTTISPLRLPAPAGTPADHLKSVKEHLHRRPRNGIGYGLLALAGDAAQISFNHLGTFDGQSSFAAAYEAVGADIGADNRRAYRIDVVSRIQDGELRTEWTYDAAMFRPETIERVARDMMDALRGLVEDARRDDVSNYSPSDLPASGLSQSEIDALREHPAWHDSDLARPLEDCYPQTPLQQGLWFQSQYAQGQGLYHVQLMHEIDQDLDKELFRQSWAEVMRRHPILRTSFWSIPDHDPLQLVWQHVPVPLTEQDWRTGTAEDQQQLLADHLQRDRIRGFDPHENPQWRILLARTGEHRHQLVLSMHHAILDGWSYALLLAEVVKVYDALVHHRRPDLHPVRPYRDYVTWFADQDMAQAERYWREVLDGVEEAAPLGIERRGAVAAAGVPGSSHAEVDRLLGRAESDRLQELAHHHRITLNTIFQGCWALMLSRYEDTDDVVFGVVVSGRPTELAGAEHMTGLFINTLPLRVRLPGAMPWSEWMRGLQEQNLQMRQYEYSPLERVQRWSGLPSVAPLFNTLCVFENYPVEQVPDVALRLSKPRSEERIHYPLGVVATLEDGQVHITAQYDPRRFDRETVERLLSHLEHLYAQVAASPEAPLAQFSLLTEQEQRQVLHWDQSDDQELLAQLVAEIQELPAGELLAQIKASTPAAEKSETDG
ncbi:non-ribosomal peptide synthetase [Micromonospora sp. LH3U1]|uniref:non-ribosomal peptide synthetase n=1 Tax=Micromonospora sp. LH3U1 TaxID=3018339 RepID=UPI00234B4BDB|nr:non-ribosomal peptide synthetase [Micromonospora sp. LH3U1]WCN79542.1 amino acid adenylation domain-containing protein [Micromonospora sp. LH3U1]